MSKFAKLMKNLKLWAVIGAVIVVIGALMLGFLGFNADATASSVKNMTVTLDSYVATDETRVDKVKDLCEGVLKDEGLSEKYDVYGESTGYGAELVYAFKENTDGKTLDKVRDALQAKLDAARGEEGNALAGAYIYVGWENAEATATIPDGYIWRGILAAAVVLVIQFAYIAVRYRLDMGIATVCASLGATLLTLALVAIFRVPVTTSVIYAVAFALLFTGVMSMFAFNAMRQNFKTEEYKDKATDDAVVSAMPVKQMLVFAGAIGVALVLVGAIAVASVRWFALAALIGVLASVFASVFFLPAVYIPMKKKFDAMAAAKARYDYKKGDKAEKTEKAKAE